MSRFLADLESRFGGVDAIFLWPTYENLGVDDRNQLQMFAAMPGGYDALRDMHHEFYAAGVRVIWGYNPWDTGCVAALNSMPPFPSNLSFIFGRNERTHNLA